MFVISDGFDSILFNLELKRHERKRQMMRYGNFKFCEDDEDSTNKVTDKSAKPTVEKTKVTEVKDRLGNLVYRRGEKDLDK